jgi:fibronectin-binding autotransporter adhesin
MKSSRVDVQNSFLRAALASTALQVPTAIGGTLYWDTNDITPGSGNAGGSWDSGTSWSTGADGDLAAQGWVNGENAVFSAGTDGLTAKTVSIVGSISTPSILLEEAGPVTLSGGAIDITGGSTFNTSVLGIAGGNQLVWTPAITGNGPLALAAHGSTSDGGDGTNSFLVLGGTNTFTGDVTITSGLLRANSSFGPLANKVILNGGGIVDPNLNLNFPYAIQIDAGQTGIYRTWGSVTTGQASGAILGSGTLKHTDGGTLTFSGDGSAFTGTINNARGTVTLTTGDWSGTRFVNSDGTALRFNATGTTTISSYEGDRDVFIPAGSRLDIASGGMKVVDGAAINSFVVQPASGGGSLTSSSGTLTLDWDTAYTATGAGTQSISVLIADFDGSTPLALVKNGPGGLSGLNQANTYSGGTTINGGRAQAQNSLAFGSGKVVVNADSIAGTAGQAWFSTVGINVPNALELAGIGPVEPSGNLGAIRFENNTIASGPIKLNADARIVALNAAVATLSGALTGSDDLEINALGATTATGSFNLTGDLSAFTGDLVVSRGRLNILGGNVGGGLLVDDEGTLSGEPAFADNVTFGFSGGAGARIIVDATTPGALHTAGNLTLNGVTTVVASGITSGANIIMTYGGTLSGTAGSFELSGGLANVRPGTAFDVSEPGVIKFNLDSAELAWTGAGGNNWNFADVNWADGITPDTFYNLDRVSFGESISANFTTRLAASNDDLVFSAVAPGAGGEAISIEYFDSVIPDTPLSVAVTGSAIRVTLAIDAANAIVSTAAQVKAVIEGDPAASALVKVSLASGDDGSGIVAALAAQNLVLAGNINIPSSSAVAPLTTTFDHSSAVSYRLSGPGILNNSPILKTGTGTLTIGHPTDYTQSATVVTGASPILIEKGNLAFGSRTALATNLPVTLGNLNSGADNTVLEVPRAVTGDQVVLTPAITLGTLTDGSTSQAIVRYTGISNGSTTTGGAPSVTGTVNLNGRDLYLENTSHQTGGTTRLWNFQPAISGTGNVRVRAGTNPDGSLNGGPRIRIQSTSNNWAGDLYLDKGDLQIGFTGQVIPDNALAIFSPGSRLTMGNTAETIRGIVGGGATEANPFLSSIANNTGGTATTRLTVNDTNAANTHVYSGGLTNGSPGAFALTKAGTATQVLNGPCSFTGSTLLNAGKLVINNTYTSAITVAAGATLGGNMTSTNSVTATAAGARIAPGVTTGTLTAASANLSTGGNLDIEVNSAATPTNDKIVTTGVLNITNATLNVSVTGSAPPLVILATYGTLTGTFATTSGIPSGYNLVYNYNNGVSSNNIALVAVVDPYVAWLATYPALTGANRSPDVDFDGDGLANGIEFVLGSDPIASGSAGIVGSTASGSNLVLTFKRSEASKAYAVLVEHGTTLASWPGQVPVPTGAVTGPPVTVVDNAAAADDITVTIPKGTDPKKFARVRANIPFTP